MTDLKREIERELSLIHPPDLWDRIQAEASSTSDAVVLDLTSARHRRRPALWLAVAAVTVLLAVVGALALLDAAQPVDTVDTPSSTSLPIRPLPGQRASPAGEYGWEGGSASATPAGMHWVEDDCDNSDGSGCPREVAAIFFAAGPRCLAASEDRQAAAVRIAGIDGISIEPYQPPVTFINTGDEITRGHALSVGGRTLCVFLTWHPSTTDGELATLAEILESIRAEPIGERVRVTFTLPEGWDTG